MLKESDMLKRTDKGEDLYYHLLGFKKFIKDASKEEIKEILERDPIYFDKTIPYAIGLRCIYVWAEKFDGLEITIPEWYEDKYEKAEIFSFPVAEFFSTIEKIFISRPKVVEDTKTKNKWSSSSSNDSDSSWGWGGSSSSSSWGSGSSSSGFGGSGGSSW